MHVCIAFEEPQQLVDDAFEGHFFGGDEREAVLQVEAHLVAKYAAGAGAGAVGFSGSRVEDVAEEVVVGLHVKWLKQKERKDRSFWLCGGALMVVDGPPV